MYVEPVNLQFVAVAILLVALVWVTVVYARSILTRRDARERAAHAAWQAEHVTLWDDARSQLEGASVTRAARRYQSIDGTWHPTIEACDAADARWYFNPTNH